MKNIFRCVDGTEHDIVLKGFKCELAVGLLFELLSCILIFASICGLVLLVLSWEMTLPYVIGIVLLFLTIICLSVFLKSHYRLICKLWTCIVHKDYIVLRCRAKEIIKETTNTYFVYLTDEVGKDIQDKFETDKKCYKRFKKNDTVDYILADISGFYRLYSL